jgi:hypothetical protein
MSYTDAWLVQWLTDVTRGDYFGEGDRKVLTALRRRLAALLAAEKAGAARVVPAKGRTGPAGFVPAKSRRRR